MKKNLINISQFDSLAAGVSQDAEQKAAAVAVATSAAIKELAKQIPITGEGIDVILSDKEPDSKSYWLYIEEVED